MACIRVLFANPCEVFYPGTEVVGTAVLDLTEKIKARHVCIHINGQAHTHWTESQSHSVTNGDGTSTTRSETIHYSATVLYMDGESIVWSSSASETKLLPGQHQFPFKFLIPANCAPSYEGCYGYIRYEVKVEIDRAWKFNKSNRKLFTVAPTFDLNSLPQSILPVETSNCKETGMVFFRHGKMSAQVRIPKSGFVPGETIVVDAIIDNNTSRPIVRAEVKLRQSARFIASRSGWSVRYAGDLMNSSRFCSHVRYEKRTVTEGEQCLDIPPKSKRSVQLFVVIPPTVSTFNTCPIISVEYYLKVKIHSKGSVNNTIDNKCPVLIGTVPLRTAPQMVTVVPSAPGPNQGNLPPPYAPGQNPAAPAPMPPSYQQSVYGNAGTTKDMENAEAFAPLYPFYDNLPAIEYPTKPSAPPIS